MSLNEKLIMDEKQYIKAVKIKETIYNLDELSDLIKKLGQGYELALTCNYTNILGNIMLKVIDANVTFRESFLRSIEYEVSKLKQRFNEL